MWPVIATTVAALVVFAVVDRQRNPRLGGAEADAAIAELDGLFRDGMRVSTQLRGRAIIARRKAAGERASPEELETRADEAAHAGGEATAWKLRLEKGRVKAADRERLQSAIQEIRTRIEQARSGARPAPAPGT